MEIKKIVVEYTESEFNIVKKAVARDVAREPKRQYHERYYQYHCPSCGVVVWDDKRFCPSCGQRMKWEEKK